jgi:hypothetical protein
MEIGDWAFSACSSLTSITVSKDNKVYDSREGCNAIIHTESNTLISGCKNTTIPKSVTKIGDEAFKDCEEFTSISIRPSKTKARSHAFRIHYDSSYNNDCDYEKPSYGRYSGSYAQDVEGWSDDEIDDVFDGDPDAYWNID